eukprot:TRINITY_DN2853_c0_g5_i1.p1 TRINITY_DN2853_c0_g5~~TRINITY_DN2853_c0_g5_i1.p1  ORF type:complete len:458 (+),score=112.10 TRINITY_DN2853_c0_g5_i1:59-1375(+)
MQGWPHAGRPPAQPPGGARPPSNPERDFSAHPASREVVRPAPPATQAAAAPAALGRPPSGGAAPRGGAAGAALPPPARPAAAKGQKAGQGASKMESIGEGISLSKQLLAEATRLVLAGADEAKRRAARDALAELDQAMLRKRAQEEAEPSPAPEAKPEQTIARERAWWAGELQQSRERRSQREAERKRLAQLAEETRSAGVLSEPEQAQWLQQMEASLGPFVFTASRESEAESARPQRRRPRSAPRQRIESTTAVVETPKPGTFDPHLTRSGLWSTVPRLTAEYLDVRGRTLLRPDWNQRFREGCPGAHGTEADRWWVPAAAIAEKEAEERAARRATDPSQRVRSPPRGPIACWDTSGSWDRAGVVSHRSPPPPSQRASRYGGFDLWSRPPPEAPPLRAPLPPEPVYRDEVQSRIFVTQQGLWPTLGRDAHDRYFCKT